LLKGEKSISLKEKEEEKEEKKNGSVSIAKIFEKILIFIRFWRIIIKLNGMEEG
jgi:hypothetical protein